MVKHIISKTLLRTALSCVGVVGSVRRQRHSAEEELNMKRCENAKRLRRGGTKGLEKGRAKPFESMHSFRLSAPLCRELESHHVKWPVGRGEVHGIVEENDKMMLNKGFTFEGAWQALPAASLEAIEVPEPETLTELRFEVTEVCCANIDTLSAALLLGDACALNFANAEIPGGRYRSGGLAQEEDLCRLLPQLYPALKSFAYPIPPSTALLTTNLLAVRRPGSYACCAPQGAVSIITAAMPIGPGRRPKGGWACSEWADTVTQRVRSVLHAAKVRIMSLKGVDEVYATKRACSLDTLFTL